MCRLPQRQTPALYNIGILYCSQHLLSSEFAIVINSGKHSWRCWGVHAAPCIALGHPWAWHHVCPTVLHVSCGTGRRQPPPAVRSSGSSISIPHMHHIAAISSWWRPTSLNKRPAINRVWRSCVWCVVVGGCDASLRLVVGGGGDIGSVVVLVVPNWG